MPSRIAAVYDAALMVTGGGCPIEAGVIGRLADHECRHGRLPGDRTRPCGCWPAEHAPVIALPTRPSGEPGAGNQAALTLVRAIRRTHIVCPARPVASATGTPF